MGVLTFKLNKRGTVEILAVYFCKAWIVGIVNSTFA